MTNPLNGLEALLEDVAHKLAHYREKTGGEYVGGIEHHQLQERLTAALAQLREQQGEAVATVAYYVSSTDAPLVEWHTYPPAGTKLFTTPQDGGGKDERDEQAVLLLQGMDYTWERGHWHTPPARPAPVSKSQAKRHAALKGEPYPFAEPATVKQSLTVAEPARSEGVDWRAMYRLQTAMRYMDNNASLTKEAAYRMADEDAAELERASHPKAGSGEGS